MKKPKHCSLHFFWHGKPVSITHTLQADRRRPDGLQMWGQAHDTHSRKSKQHSAPYLARQTATVTWSRTTLNFTTNKRRVNYLEILQLFWCVGLWDEYDDRVIPARWHTGMVPPFSTSSTYHFTFSQQELRSSCKILVRSIFVIVVDILNYILSGFYISGTMDHRLRLNNLETTGSFSSKTASEPYTPYQRRPYHSWLEEGHLSKKN
jgi:hypothetical protein